MDVSDDEEGATLEATERDMYAALGLDGPQPFLVKLRKPGGWMTVGATVRPASEFAYVTFSVASRKWMAAVNKPSGSPGMRNIAGNFTSERRAARFAAM